MSPKPEAVAEIIKSHGYYDTPNGSACSIVRELAKAIDADVATAASMRKKGWQGLGRAWDLISPRIAEYADALASAKPPVAPDAPCRAVNGLGHTCARKGPHEAHTYEARPLVDPAALAALSEADKPGGPVIGEIPLGEHDTPSGPILVEPGPTPGSVIVHDASKPGGPVEQHDNPSDPQAEEAPQGEPVICGLSDEYGGGTPDACLLDRAHIDRGENHQGKFSRWPARIEDAARWLAANAPDKLNPEAVVAFIKGETDDLELPEPAPVTGELVAVGAPGEMPTFNLAPLPRAPLPDEEIPAALPPMELRDLSLDLGPSLFPVDPPTIVEAPVQPDPFANAGIVPDSDIRRTATWRPAPDPRPLWLPREAAPMIPNSIRVTQVRMGEACGLQYRLVSRDEVPEVPAWWNAGGTALHACAQRFEDAIINGVHDLDWLANMPAEMAAEWFAYEFAVAIAATEPETPFPRHQWRAAAKGTEGYDWWVANGPEMVRSYAAASAEWHREGWSILHLPPSRPGHAFDPAMELEMRYGLPLGGELVGHLDQAWIKRHEDGRDEIRVRDLKSGGSVTDDEWQPEAYAMLLRTRLAATGMDVASVAFSAVYYDARNGKDKEPWTVVPAAVETPDGRHVEGYADFHMATLYRASSVYRMHEANNYPANPGSDWKAPCYLCPVRYACPIMALKE